ncbi:MAG: hypothetical protein GY940_40240 [bacterium]|nr:hypothetical protein [bacterium]
MFEFILFLILVVVSIAVGFHYHKKKEKKDEERIKQQNEEYRKECIAKRESEFREAIADLSGNIQPLFDIKENEKIRFIQATGSYHGLILEGEESGSGKMVTMMMLTNNRLLIKANHQYCTYMAFDLKSDFKEIRLGVGRIRFIVKFNESIMGDEPFSCIEFELSVKETAIFAKLLEELNIPFDSSRLPREETESESE